MLTQEEANAASVIATQNSLIELGRQTAKFELQKDLREKKIIELKKYLLKGKEVFPIGVEYTKINKTTEFYVHLNELEKYLNAVNKFIKIIDIKEEEYISTINKSEIELNDLRLENKTIILENNNLEETLTEKEQYWTTRVYKLREKCKEKNSNYEKLLYRNNLIIKTTIFIILSVSLFEIIIIYKDKEFKKFIEDINYVFYNIFYLVYFILYYLCKFILYISLIFRDYYLLISSISFGLIGLKYLQIKKLFSFIVIGCCLAFFINNSNSVY
tara:strand:+ start:4486 stop:5301 length:816 start_codon:yes stop_codon:yes gene_type:complete